MKTNPLSQTLLTFFVSLTLCFLNTSQLSAQFYAIFGPIEIPCTFEPSSYFLEVQTDIVSTEWEVIPSEGVLINSSGIFDASFLFSQPGTYQIISQSLTQNQNHLHDTLTVYVYSLDTPPEISGCYILDQDEECYQVCAFSQTELIFHESVAIFEVSGAESYYHTGNGQQETIVITWGPGGQGIVNLQTSPELCPYVLCFDILPIPEADFEVPLFPDQDTITVCRDQNIEFENHSLNGLSYLWSFGDGEQSGDYHTSHAYSSPGFYTITLQAESICDCGDEKSLIVEVLPSPAPTLDCINSICPGTRQSYNATTDGCTSYHWSVSGNGTITNGGESSDDFIEVIWHEGPEGFIELSVAGCQSDYCATSNIFRIPIISPDGPVSGKTSVCAGEITTYTAPFFPGTQYDWDISAGGIILDGQNSNAVTIRWNDVAQITQGTVSVEYNNCFLECGGTANLDVTISPRIYLSGALQVCQGEEAAVSAFAGFTSLVPAIVSWHIEDEDGQVLYTAPGDSHEFTHQFNYPAGTYTWVANNFSNSYCNNRIDLSIQVTEKPPLPQAILGESEICPGQTYGYTLENAGNYRTFWTVTDGTNTFNYQGKTFNHTFGSSPPYLIEVVQADIQFLSCLSDPISLTVNAIEDLAIEGPAEACNNSIDQYSSELVTGVDYSWEIIPPEMGEVKKTNLNNIEVFWTGSGNAIVRLSLCGMTFDQNVLVHALPQFQITGPLSACENEQVTIATDQPGYEHIWMDSDGIAIGTESDIELFPGEYAVEVTDNFGCQSRKAFRIMANPAPVVHLSSPNDKFYCNLIPTGVNIIANTDGDDYQYTWYRNDIDIGPGGPVYTVNDFGSYHVAVTNQYGCVAVSEKIEYQNCCAPNPCGDPGGPGSPVPGCLFLVEDLMAEVIQPACDRRRYTLLHPDAMPSTTQWLIRSVSKGVIAFEQTDVFDFTYDYPGYYRIDAISTLTGFPYGGSTCGHFETIKDTIRAVADFDHQGVCSGETFDFEDLTTFLPGESIMSWNWNFDDPASGADNTANTQHPNHIFSAPGIYNVELSIQLMSGCMTTVVREVMVSDGPVIAPVFESIYCENEALAFTLPGQAFNITWDFGDPASGTQNMAAGDSVFHGFDLPGLYTVQIEASDIHSCVSQFNFNVDVRQNTLGGLIDVNPAGPLCEGDAAALTAPTGGVYWEWSNGETTESIEVKESDQYGVFIQDVYYCTYAPPPVFIEVRPRPEIAVRGREVYGPDAFGHWQHSLALCDGVDFQLEVFSDGMTNLQWGHGSSQATLHFSAESGNLPGPGIHEFTVVGIDPATACVSDTQKITVEIFPLPVKPQISLTSGTGCGNSPNTIEVLNPVSGIQYLWSNGMEGTSIQTEKEGTYTVNAISPFGCSHLSTGIFIKATVPLDKIPGGCFIECDPKIVCLPPLSQVSSYTIYHNGNVLSSGNNWPQDFTADEDGTYTIEVTSTNGCTVVSEPLYLELYQGKGTITVLTYEDIDGDGLIGPGDILISGIPVQIASDNGLFFGASNTAPEGKFDFPDFPATSYLASIDRNLLSSQWTVIIDSLAASIQTCGDSVTVSLLLRQNCTVTGPDVVAEICPGEFFTLGDSIWSDTGSYEIHFESIAGCDSVFNVHLLPPDSLEIIGTVWVDLDHDGNISSADTVIQAIPMQFLHLLSGFSGYEFTDDMGNVFAVMPSGGILVSIDTALLPQNFSPLIFEILTSEDDCGTLILDFLIRPLCPQVFQVTSYSICAGDSVYIEGQWYSESAFISYEISDPVTLCDTIVEIIISQTEEMVIQSEVDWRCDSLGSIQLTVDGEAPFSYFWSPIPFDSSAVFFLDEGNYSVEVVDANGCSQMDSFGIAAPPVPVFSIDEEYSIAEGDSVLISIAGDVNLAGLTFSWIPGGILSCASCSSTLAFPLEDTTITILITDAEGCEYTLQTHISVEALPESRIFAPNIFSPNGDGVNDQWEIYLFPPDTPINRIVVFDRWGNLVSGDEQVLSFSWDGKFDGKPMNPGVFVYVIHYEDQRGKERMITGDFVLIR